MHLMGSAHVGRAATTLPCYAVSAMSVPAKGGLEDVVATSSSICFIDGERGVLSYCGYDIHDLAQSATFEEVCYLLWHRRLPNRAELGIDRQLGLATRARDDEGRWRHGATLASASEVVKGVRIESRWATASTSSPGRAAAPRYARRRG